MSPPRISVVIPAHDRGGVLPRSVGSVLAQTLPPLEVIVVDDASTDETERVVRELGARYVRLDARSGAQAARNRGVTEATGDWIAFQDSDDEWLPDKLERQVALLEDEWTVAHGRATKPMRWLLGNDEHPLDTLLQRPATLFPALLVSRAALDRMGPLDEDLESFQEWDTSIRLAEFCRFVAPDDPVFVYHRSHDAISASRRHDIEGYARVIEKHRAGMSAGVREQHMRFLARRALEFGLWDEARLLLAQVDRRDSRYWRLRALNRLRLRPTSVTRLRRLLTWPRPF